ncbi:MAG: C40 family peptidase [Verrucomicrobiales bacterium]|nr:C40 family peptidase [Verrucomicrobiales bacterium]
MNAPFFSLSRSILIALLIAALGTPASVDARLFKREVPAVQNRNTGFAKFFRPKPKSYDLPYAGWQFEPASRPQRSFFGNPEPTPQMRQLITVLRARAETISRFGLPYKFGGEHPTEGGLDCSGTMQFMLKDLGFGSVPRTSYHQYEWLKKARTMNHTKTIPAQMGGKKGIKPGDLIFWGGTYNSGHKVSHVMIYLGQGNDGQHWMFGARGKKKKGLNGAGVDIFKLNAGYQKSLVGYGSLPGAF